MKRKILSLFLICIFTFTWSFSAFADDSSQTASMTQTDAPGKIVFLGDSIAAGYGLAGYTGTSSASPKDSYASILGEKYKNELSDVTQAQMVNLAVSGYTSSQVLSSLEDKQTLEQLTDSDVVVISAGGNDVMGPLLAFVYVGLGVKSPEDMNKLDPKVFSDPKTELKMKPTLAAITMNISAFTKNIKKITEIIHSKTDARIIVQTVYNPLDSEPGYADLSKIVGEKLGELNKAINDCSDTGKNYTVCDISAAFAGKSAELTNIGKLDIHPSAAGHKVIAQELDKVIKTAKYSIETKPVLTSSSPDESSSSAPESVSRADNSSAASQEVSSQQDKDSSNESRADSSSSDDSEIHSNKMDKTTLYVTLGLFFGGFIAVFAIVMIKFKKSR